MKSSTCCISLLIVSISAFILFFSPIPPPPAIRCLGSGCIRCFSPFATFLPHPGGGFLRAAVQLGRWSVDTRCSHPSSAMPWDCPARSWQAFDQNKSAAATRYLRAGKWVQVCAVKRKVAQGSLESISCHCFPCCGQKRKAGGWHAWGQNRPISF